MFKKGTYFNKTYKIELKPNKEQIRVFNEAFGYRRFCYNRGLKIFELLKKYYSLSGKYYYDKKGNLKLYKNPSHQDLIFYIKKYYKQDWESSQINQVLDTSLMDLDKAFKNFKNKNMPKHLYPKIKSKKRELNTFKLYRKSKWDFGIINENILKLPIPKSVINNKLIKMKEKLILSEKERIQNVSIVKRVNKYFACIVVRKDNSLKKTIKNKSSEVGIDLGIKDLAVISDNFGKYKKYRSILPRIKPLYSKIKKYNKMLSKKYESSLKNHNKFIKSNNFIKVKNKLNKTYLKIENIINDYINKITTYLVQNYNVISIEDLKISNMIKNKRLSYQISNSNWRKFRTKLEEKAVIYNNEIRIIDRFFPSSKKCSSCGNIKKDLKLTDRIYKCNKCGFIKDRDFNASVNIRQTDQVVGQANEGSSL